MTDAIVRWVITILCIAIIGVCTVIVGYVWWEN